MSQIFIANPTLQHRELHIRINKTQVRIVRIRASGQEMFPDDLEGDSLTRVLKQLDAAGGVPASDPKAIRGRFSLLYSVSDSRKPIAAKAIDAGMKQDEAVRQELSSEILEKSTIEAFNLGARVGGREVTMEVTEVNDQGPVQNGVDFEITASAKRGVGAGKRATGKKR